MPLSVETPPPAGFSHLPQSPHFPGGWGCILSGPLQAQGVFEVSRFILKTRISGTLCSITPERMLLVENPGICDLDPDTFRMVGRASHTPGTSGRHSW